MFTDSHCHLSFPELKAQLPQIRLAMQAAQVERALCICTTLEEFDDVHELALSYDNFWATVGVHPDNEDVQEPSLEDLLLEASPDTLSSEALMPTARSNRVVRLFAAATTCLSWSSSTASV